jgi:hypothetical protein
MGMLPPMQKDSDELAPEGAEDPETEGSKSEVDEPSPKQQDARDRAGRPSRRPKAKHKPLTEEEINSPKKQTLYMLGAIAASTVLLWGAARFACNAHPPDSRRARLATTDQLARTPKGAAVELQQRWAGHKFVEALELAKGDVADQLQKDLRDCESNLSACDSKREQLEGKVSSMGELISGDARTAKVRVRTTTGNDTQTFVLDLEAAGLLWKAVKRSPDKG